MRKQTFDPMATIASMAATALTREARSALPASPVVADVPRQPRLVGVRHAIAAALETAARKVEPRATQATGACSPGC